MRRLHVLKSMNTIKQLSTPQTKNYRPCIRLSIVHVTPVGIQDSSYSSPHGSAVSSELILWNRRTFFQQSCPQLLPSFGRMFTLADTHTEQIPDIFNGIQIWTFGWPRQDMRHSPRGSWCTHEPPGVSHCRAGTRLHPARSMPIA